MLSKSAATLSSLDYHLFFVALPLLQAQYCWSTPYFAVSFLGSLVTGTLSPITLYLKSLAIQLD